MPRCESDGTFRSSLLITIRGVSMFVVASVVAGCGEESRVSGQIPDPKFRFDRFSGITVSNETVAEGLIVYRYGNAPNRGEPFPDGPLFEASTDRVSRIHELVSKRPTVVIFGSSSCSHLDLFVDELGPMAERYGAIADFHFVYIREAHPEGGFQPILNRDGQPYLQTVHPDTVTLEERKERAKGLSTRIGDKITVWVDSMEDELAVRWSAWPARVFVLGVDGKVAYSGGPGPWYMSLTEDGWHDPPPEHLEALFRRKPFDMISLEKYLEARLRSRNS